MQRAAHHDGARAEGLKRRQWVWCCSAGRCLVSLSKHIDTAYASGFSVACSWGCCSSSCAEQRGLTCIRGCSRATSGGRCHTTGRASRRAPLLVGRSSARPPTMFLRLRKGCCLPHKSGLSHIPWKFSACSAQGLARGSPVRFRAPESIFRRAQVHDLVGGGQGLTNPRHMSPTESRCARRCGVQHP